MSDTNGSIALPGSDAAINQAFEQRRQQRLATLPEPRFPASGTELVAARLAAARAQLAGATVTADVIDLSAEPDAP